MKKVEFVRVKSLPDGYGLVKGMKYTFDGVEKIIEKRIVDGWSFEGYVPIQTRSTGEAETISLIFTKEE